MTKPSGIIKIEKGLLKAKEKGFKISKIYGVFSSFVKAKKLTALPYNEQINQFNDYLKTYNLVCFTNRKGLFFSSLTDYKPSNEYQLLNW